MAFSFAACSASGTYKFDSMTVKILTEETTYKAGDEYNGKKLETDSVKLILNGDGTCSIKLMDSESESTGTWTEEDGTITFDVAGLPFSKATRDGSKITFSYSLFGVSVSITLKK